MFRDEAHRALKAAAGPARERVRRDREDLPERFARILGHIEENLFHPDLSVGSARRAAGARDNSISTDFKAHTGSTFRTYISELRLGTAERMLVGSSIALGRVAQAVGYTNYRSFWRAYSAWAGESPRDARERARNEAESTEDAAPARDDELLEPCRKALQGKLSDEEARALLERLYELYPHLREVPSRTARGSVRVMHVDGGAWERYFAEAEVWPKLRGLPFEEQRDLVAGYAFGSTALFDLLRAKSREEGRRDRGRGVELAELALVSLDASADLHGERLHDSRAFGWAWLGNARRLALDLPGAEEAFRRAYDHWRAPRSAPSEEILAEIHHLEASLRLYQRTPARALELVDRAIFVFRRMDLRERLASGLTKRAAILEYAGRDEEGRPSLEEAVALLVDSPSEHLRLVIEMSLARVEVQSGDWVDARERLKHCEEVCMESNSGSLVCQVSFLWGMLHGRLGELEEAEIRFRNALAGFLQHRELDSAADSMVELAAVYLRQSRFAEALICAADAIPIFDALSIFREALVAKKLLQEAVRSQRFTEHLIAELRSLLKKIRSDPAAAERIHG